MEHYSTAYTFASGCHLKVNSVDFSFCEVGEVCMDVLIHMKMLFFFIIFFFSKTVCVCLVSPMQTEEIIYSLFPDGTQRPSDFSRSNQT